MSEEYTIKDVIDVVTSLSEKMDTRFDRLEQRVDRIEQRVDRIETTMATKDDLHTLQDNLYNQLLSVDKKTNIRVDAVVGALDAQNVITPAQTAQLLTMEPFPNRL